MLLIGKITAVRDGKTARSAICRRVVTGVFAGLIVVSVFASAAPADQIPSLQAQANQLAAQIGKGASRIAALTAQYNKYSQQAIDASSQLAAAQAQLTTTQQTINANRETLHREAVTAYMEDGGARGMAVAGDAANSLIVRQQYMQLASGNVVETLDRLRVGLSDLRTAETSLQQAQVSAQHAADRVTQARQAALMQATQEQQTLNSIHGQLATMVAQAAAQAAARQSGARSTQGLPVNGGLLAVVTRAVSPPPTPGHGPGPPPPPPPPSGGGGGAGGVWAALRQCESSGNYAENSGNGYYGAYQFSQATWTWLGYPGRPDQEPPAMQDAAAQKLQAQSGWGQWPACAAALGLI